MHRSEDEVTLRILDMRKDGVSFNRAALELGMSPYTVRKRVARVIDADCLHDPEAEEYWKGFPK
jgi:hypothetical protein